MRRAIPSRVAERLTFVRAPATAAVAWHGSGANHGFGIQPMVGSLTNDCVFVLVIGYAKVEHGLQSYITIGAPVGPLWVCQRGSGQFVIPLGITLVQRLASAPVTFVRAQVTAAVSSAVAVMRRWQ